MLQKCPLQCCPRWSHPTTSVFLALKLSGLMFQVSLNVLSQVLPNFFVTDLRILLSIVVFQASKSEPTMSRMCSNPVCFSSTAIPSLHQQFQSVLLKLSSSLASSTYTSPLSSLLQGQPGGVCSHCAREEEFTGLQLILLLRDSHPCAKALCLSGAALQAKACTWHS